MIAVRAPLEDLTYRPAHPPVNGEIPLVVEKWGPRSQLRWFDRYRGQLRHRPVAEWARFFCSSTEHRGLCCGSCEADYWDGFFDLDDRCCCISDRDRP